MNIGIIADDLTSAADSGIQFARRGYFAKVWLHGKVDPTWHDDIVVIDTDSRAQRPEEAQRRTRQCAGQLSQSCELIYKTVDSTLRGHLALELSALLSGTKIDTAILAPAFPAQGRITRNGVQMLYGRPVHESEFAADPTHPVTSSNIASLLRCPDLEPIIQIDAGALRNRQFVQGAVATARCLLVDSESQEDLQSLVRAVANWSGVCWAGSPGLARALADEIPGARPEQPALSWLCKRVLVVVGSRNPASRKQTENLLRQEYAVVLPANFRKSGDGHDSALHQIKERLQAKPVVVLASPQEFIRQDPLANRSPSWTLESLAETVHSVLSERLVDALVLTGGATALAVLHRIGIHGLELQSELLPGIPVGRAIDFEGLLVVTKAGGFGCDQTLTHLCSALLHPEMGTEKK